MQARRREIIDGLQQLPGALTNINVSA